MMKDGESLPDRAADCGNIPEVFEVDQASVKGIRETNAALKGQSLPTSCFIRPRRS